jgi:hypothetical protein
MIDTKLETDHYIFYIENNQLKVKYRDEKMTQDLGVDTVNLCSITVESVGVVNKKDSPPFVTIVTPASVQKLKNKITDTLEIIGFQAKDINEAIAINTFVVLWLDKLKVNP